MSPAARRFRAWSAATIAATLAVILWGAFVRATGSGAGCGNHWPTCNGQVIPRPENIKTVIEFTHRLTSGLAFLLVLGQLAHAWRVFPHGHGARRAAAAALILMITEALVGAGLVLFEMVAGNGSIARAGWMGTHLVNTFALLAALVLTWKRSADPLSVVAHEPPRPRTAALMALGALVLVAVSGAIAALGDTLFPARSLQEGMASDLSPAAHVFVRLRVIHPVLAVATGIVLLVGLGLLVGRRGFESVRGLATFAGVLVLCQLAAGVANLVLLAPVALQLVHLLLADLLWMTLVVLAATLLRGPAPGYDVAA